jgi:hypothetical protein
MKRLAGEGEDRELTAEREQIVVDVEVHGAVFQNVREMAIVGSRP